MALRLHTTQYVAVIISKQLAIVFTKRKLPDQFIVTNRCHFYQIKINLTVTLSIRFGFNQVLGRIWVRLIEVKVNLHQFRYGLNYTVICGLRLYCVSLLQNALVSNNPIMNSTNVLPKIPILLKIKRLTPASDRLKKFVSFQHTTNQNCEIIAKQQ